MKMLLLTIFRGTAKFFLVFFENLKRLDSEFLVRFGLILKERVSGGYIELPLDFRMMSEEFP